MIQSVRLGVVAQNGDCVPFHAPQKSSLVTSMSDVPRKSRSLEHLVPPPIPTNRLFGGD